LLDDDVVFDRGVAVEDEAAETTALVGAKTINFETFVDFLFDIGDLSVGTIKLFHSVFETSFHSLFKISASLVQL
jgi:hypothetical protein